MDEKKKVLRIKILEADFLKLDKQLSHNLFRVFQESFLYVEHIKILPINRNYLQNMLNCEENMKNIVQGSQERNTVRTRV